MWVWVGYDLIRKVSDDFFFQNYHHKACRDRILESKFNFLCFIKRNKICSPTEYMLRDIREYYDEGKVNNICVLRITLIAIEKRVK